MSTPHAHFPPSSPSSKLGRSKARRYGLLGCGGCLGVAVLIFALIGLLTTLGLGGGTTAATTAASPEASSIETSTATPTPSSTPSAAEPTAIDGEVLTTHAEGTTVKTVDGTAPRKAPDSDVKALAALGALEVKGRAPKTGYDREKFGAAWADVDGNGCDTRNDILHRDLDDAVTSDGCTVTSGTLDPDPYTDTTIEFTRGVETSAEVQIDHVVALSDAWQKGGQHLDADTRVVFANDPLNLLAVDGPTNQAKGDSDAASWLPPHKAFRCEYVAIQIAVKAKYNLWITQAEKDAMTRVLNGCEGQTLPVDDGTVTGETDALAVAIKPKPSPAQKTTQPTPAPAPVREAPVSGGGQKFQNCDEAAAVGMYNIAIGSSSYSADLDRDGDGIACENSDYGSAPVPAAPAKPAAPAPVAPAPAPKVAPAPVAPAPAAPGIPYPNCTAVYADGLSHLTPAHPRWQSGLDGSDNDGVGCEGP